MESLPISHLEWAKLHLKELFDLDLSSLSIVYSAKGLRFWEGAVTWIDRGTARIQLHPKLKKGSLLFGLYSRDEILAHEAIHASRADLEGPKYEEHLAYWSSPSPMRRLLGPLFQRPLEAPLFLMSSLVPPLAALLTVGLALRLILRQRRLATAFRTLRSMAPNDAAARGILLRSEDREIELFSRISPSELLFYLSTQPRWQPIYHRYFQKVLNVSHNPNSH